MDCVNNFYNIMFGSHFIKAITHSRMWYIEILSQLTGVFQPEAQRRVATSVPLPVVSYCLKIPKHLGSSSKKKLAVGMSSICVLPGFCKSHLSSTAQCHRRRKTPSQCGAPERPNRGVQSHIYKTRREAPARWGRTARSLVPVTEHHTVWDLHVKQGPVCKCQICLPLGSPKLPWQTGKIKANLCTPFGSMDLHNMAIKYYSIPTYTYTLYTLLSNLI